jgi:sarcosine/dimethylglycine N-methyltransferase
MKNTDHVLAFYSRHPISRDQILSSAHARRGHSHALAPEDLFPFDQDHYGGLAMVDVLAERGNIGPDCHVADFCAGLGGPARYLARQYGALVTCIELNPDRASGASDLCERVGLARSVRMVRADVARVPLLEESMDVVISQEALLHVPDKKAALSEAYRVLKPGGRLTFTDWATHRSLNDADADCMWRGIAAQSIQSFVTYPQLLQAAGFGSVQTEDLTSEWARILEERFAMYRKLREETQRIGTPSGDSDFYRSYARLVALVQGGTLGGGRFTVQK